MHERSRGCKCHCRDCVFDSFLPDRVYSEPSLSGSFRSKPCQSLDIYQRLQQSDTESWKRGLSKGGWTVDSLFRMTNRTYDFCIFKRLGSHHCAKNCREEAECITAPTSEFSTTGNIWKLPGVGHIRSMNEKRMKGAAWGTMPASPTCFPNSAFLQKCFNCLYSNGTLNFLRLDELH